MKGWNLERLWKGGSKKAPPFIATEAVNFMETQDARKLKKL